MSVDAHRQAEAFMARAEEREAAGSTEDASTLYGEAAKYEAIALAQIPLDRVRTRGIIGVSAVSLHLQAGQTAEARSLAYSLLAESSLPDDAREQLLDIALDVERQRQASEDERVLSGESFIVSLRGAGVRAGGLVPLDTVVLKLQQFRGYVVRVGEWVGRRPFREKGSPPAEIVRACVPLIAPATAGSYRFELKLEAPAQLVMFDPERALSPDVIADEFFRVLDDVTTDDPAFNQHVDNAQYREAFTKLVRGLVPNGDELLEVEVTRKRTGASTVLKPEMREPIQRRVLATLPDGGRGNVRYGVLRALHLDEGWLVLVQEGKEQRCRIQRGRVLDDVVGPLVNRRVGVTGQWRGSARLTFEVNDIFEAAGQVSATERVSRRQRSLDDGGSLR